MGPDAKCSCFNNFFGAGCYMRRCPNGSSWVTFPEDTNTHPTALEECSGAGVCDRVTGLCTCREGFGGSACEMMMCPFSVDDGECSGK